MHSLEFDLVPDDLVAFNMQFIATSEIGRRQLRNSRIATTGLGAFLTGAVLLSSDGWVPALIGATLAGVILWLWMPRSIRRTIAKRLAKSSSDLGIAGAHTLTIEDAGIREYSPSGSSFTEWGSICSVAETESHAFIFFGPVQAYIVPRLRARGDVDAFLSAVRGRCSC